MLNSSKKPRITKSNDGETFGRKSVHLTSQDAASPSFLPLFPVQHTSENYDEFNFFMASKRNDLLQASLRILIKRRNDLVSDFYVIIISYPFLCTLVVITNKFAFS